MTEAKLNLALNEIMKGRTTFVIAQGLSTIPILVFDNDKVIESGTFDELVARRAAFAQLARTRVHGAGKRPLGDELGRG